MDENEAIINPGRGKKSPKVGPLAAMVAVDRDMHGLVKLACGEKVSFSPLLMSRLYREEGFSILGPMVGSPYAGLLMETLIAWGVRKFVFFGLCGAIDPEIKIGDVILPNGSFIDEGLSPSYGEIAEGPSFASEALRDLTKDALKKNRLEFHEGLVLTTDAVFRETKGKIRSYQDRGALGVDMECSALFTISGFRKVEISAILVVSDELSTLTWEPGFGNPVFKKTCKKVISAINYLFQALQDEQN